MEAIETLCNHLNSMFMDERLETIVCETQLCGVPKSPRITARLFLVQGAVQTMAHAHGKNYIGLTPMELKKHYWPGVWKKKSHAENKQQVVDHCVSLFGEHYRQYSDHACDAKLLAMVYHC